MTLLEVFVVVVVVFILVAIFLPAMRAPHSGSHRVHCINNLKQVGLAFRIWEGDHGDKYPMSVSVTNGGVMELTGGLEAWKTFLVMSNELSTPKILICPEDTEHFSATNFSVGFSAQNISYFIGLDADESNPQMLLSGDDNFAIGGVPVKSGRLDLTTNTPVTWTAARHHFAGNIAVADGSVQQLSQSGLKHAIQQTSLATNHFAIP